MNSKKIFTIPNILSFIRILLVPIIVWMYFDTSINNNYLVAFVLVILSALTDVCDGIIARKFNLITDLGKILDPIADKLTQFAVVCCIAFQNEMMRVVAVAIFAKEILMLIGAVIFVKNGNETPYARWWGKITTALLYATMLLFILADFINDFITEEFVLPPVVEVTAVSLCIAFLAFSFLNYALIFIESKKKSKKQNKSNKL